MHIYFPCSDHQLLRTHRYLRGTGIVMHRSISETFDRRRFLFPHLPGSFDLVGVQQRASKRVRQAVQDLDGGRGTSYPGSAQLPESNTSRINTREQHLATIPCPDSRLSNQLLESKIRGIHRLYRLADLRILPETVLALFRSGVAITVPQQKAGEFIVSVFSFVYLFIFLLMLYGNILKHFEMNAN